MTMGDDERSSKSFGGYKKLARGGRSYANESPWSTDWPTSLTAKVHGRAIEAPAGTTSTSGASQPSRILKPSPARRQATVSQCPAAEPPNLFGLLVDRREEQRTSRHCHADRDLLDEGEEVGIVR